MQSKYGWKEDELEKIAESVRLKLIPRATTIDNYVRSAEDTPSSQIGLIKLWIIKNEPFMARHFPDLVYQTLVDKISDRLYAPEEVKRFLSRYNHKGTKWIAAHLYLSESSVRERASAFSIPIPNEKVRLYNKKDDVKIVELIQSGKTDGEIAEILHRSSNAIALRRRKTFGMHKEKDFDWKDHPDERNYIVHHCDEKPKFLSKHTQMPYARVRKLVEYTRSCKKSND